MLELGQDEGDEGGDGDAEREAEKETSARFLPCDAQGVAGADFTQGHGADDHGGSLAAGVAARGDDHGQEER